MSVVAVDNFRLTAALGYAAIGWHVVPLHWPKVSATGAVRCSCGHSDCGSVGKHPLTPSGLKDASADAAVLRAWWQEWPAANIGVQTGAGSGIIAVDVDPRGGGGESLAELCDCYGQFPETVEARTGGDGLHVFFRHPGHTVRNSAGKLGPGLDVRGDGGYVVAAPSLHASGQRYRWMPSADPQSAAVAAAPNWLLHLLHEPKPTPPTSTPPRVESADDVGRFWLEKALSKATVGNRNNLGLWLACQLRDARLSEAAAWVAMRDYVRGAPAGDKPYTEREAAATMRHVFRSAPRDAAKSLTPLARPQPPARKIEAAPENAATELKSYLSDVVSGKIVDARLPWPLLSHLSCSMLPGSVTTICGDPGVGKTFFVLECLRFWHGNGHEPAAYFIEKNRRFYSMRLLAQLQEDGRYVDHDWIARNPGDVDAALTRHADYIADLGKCIHSSPEGRVSLEGLLGWVRQQASAGRRVLIVDPITAVNAGDNRWHGDDEFMVEASRICIAHGTSLVLVTHPRKGNVTKKSGHDVGGGAAYFRFCDTLIWINRVKKPRRVRVKCISSVGVRESVERVGLFFEMHKTRDGKGAGTELAYSFGEGLHFAEHGIVTGELRDNDEGEAA